MNDGLPAVDSALLEAITAHDELMRFAVADVTDVGSGATIVADGRAPDLPEFNHAALIRAERDGFLEGLVGFFEKRNRKPSFILDPGAPPATADRLAGLGFRREEPSCDLMLWNPSSPHIFTAPEAYMTLATNATLSTWLDIFTADMEEPLRAQARTMWTLLYRAPGVTFWFGLHNGIHAGACPLFVDGGLGRCGPVHVSREFRRKGVGLALFNYVTRQSRKDGATITYAYNEQNGPATGICRTSGYQTVALDARQVWTRTG